MTSSRGAGDDEVLTWSITRRGRLDPMSISDARDFRLRRAPATDVDSLIGDPNVSLYCLDQRRRRALLVRTPEGVRPELDPFYYQAQYRHATGLIGLSYEQFHRMADRMRRLPRHHVAIHSVGRCGSTLLSRMFASQAVCLSLSEPDVYSQLLVGDFPDADVRPLLRSAGRLAFNPARDDQSHLVLKFRSFCVELAEDIHATARPQSVLFLYRDAERVVESGMRAFRTFGSALSVIDLAHRLVVTRPALVCLFARHRDVARRLFPWMRHYTAGRLSRTGAVGILAIAWLSAMDRYLTLHRAGFPIRALLYDDLASRPREVLERVFPYCSLPDADVDAALRPMERDSQAESVVARDRTRRRWRLSSTGRRTIQQVLDEHPVIRRADFRLPGDLMVGESAASR